MANRPRTPSGLDALGYNEFDLIGEWRSLVARCVRDAEVPGSNPGSPTNMPKYGPNWSNFRLGPF